MDLTPVTNVASYVLYAALALIALWGAFCVILVWRRVTQTSFRSEREQAAFLDQIEESLAAGDFEGAARLCDGDERAMAQLALLGLSNRQAGYAKVRELVSDRFQRDVLADLEFRLDWVYTVIKSAPMVGLLGTVVGMMGAFQGLTAPDRGPDATALAANISLALVTTALGLTIAIPLVLCTASLRVQIRKLEDLVGVGMTRFLEVFRASLARNAAVQAPPPTAPGKVAHVP